MAETNQNEAIESVKERLETLVRSTEEVRDKVTRMKKDRKNRSE